MQKTSLPLPLLTRWAGVSLPTLTTEMVSITTMTSLPTPLRLLRSLPLVTATMPPLLPLLAIADIRSAETMYPPHAPFSDSYSSNSTGQQTYYMLQTIPSSYSNGKVSPLTPSDPHPYTPSLRKTTPSNNNQATRIYSRIANSVTPIRLIITMSTV